MKALRIALEEAKVNTDYDSIAENISALSELGDYAQNQDTSTPSVSLESVFDSFRERDFQCYGQARQFSVAMEEQSAGVWALIIAAAIAVVVALKKFLSWAFGGSSSGSSGGGHVSLTATKLEETSKIVKVQNGQIEKLDDVLKAEQVVVEPTQEQPKRKQINNVDDLVELYPPQDAGVHAAFKFLKAPDSLSVDILEKGEYFTSMSGIVKELEHSGLGALRDEFKEVQALIDAKKRNEITEEMVTKIEASNEKHVKDFKVKSMNSMGIEEAVTKIKNLHRSLADKTHEHGYKLSDLHKKMADRMDNDIFDARTLVDGVEDSLKDISDTLEKISIELHAANQHSSEQDQSEEAVAARRVGRVMKIMSNVLRLYCEMMRQTYIMMKGVLTIAVHIRQVGYAALRLLDSYVLPRVKDPDSKERIKAMAKEIRQSYSKYHI